TSTVARKSRKLSRILTPPLRCRAETSTRLLSAPTFPSQPRPGRQPPGRAISHDRQGPNGILRRPTGPASGWSGTFPSATGPRDLKRCGGTTPATGIRARPGATRRERPGRSHPAGKRLGQAVLSPDRVGRRPGRGRGEPEPGPPRVSPWGTLPSAPTPIREA